MLTGGARGKRGLKSVFFSTDDDKNTSSSSEEEEEEEDYSPYGK